MSFHIETIPNQANKPAVLLRQAWREGQRVRKKTLANLSRLPPDIVDGFRKVSRAGSRSWTFPSSCASSAPGRTAMSSPCSAPPRRHPDPARRPVLVPGGALLPLGGLRLQPGRQEGQAADRARAAVLGRRLPPGRRGVRREHGEPGHGEAAGGAHPGAFRDRPHRVGRRPRHAHHGSHPRGPATGLDWISALPARQEGGKSRKGTSYAGNLARICCEVPPSLAPAIEFTVRLGHHGPALPPSVYCTCRADNGPPDCRLPKVIQREASPLVRRPARMVSRTRGIRVYLATHSPSRRALASSARLASRLGGARSTTTSLASSPARSARSISYPVRMSSSLRIRTGRPEPAIPGSAVSAPAARTPRSGSPASRAGSPAPPAESGQDPLFAYPRR